jgi:hypothetical protein
MKRRLRREQPLKRSWSFQRAWRQTDIGDHVFLWRADKKQDPPQRAVCTRKRNGPPMKEIWFGEGPSIHPYAEPWRWTILEKSKNNPPTPLDKDNE